MDWTGGARTPRAALVAVRPGRALGFARSFGDAGFVPTLAFTAAQLEEYAGAVDVIVADEHVDQRAETLCRAGASEQTIRMFVSEQWHARPELHALLPADVSPVDLVARANALLALRGDRTTWRVLRWGPMVLDQARREARWHGTRLKLTPTQFRIVSALVRARGTVLTRLDLQREVWPGAPPDEGERLVAHIRRIRAKIEIDPSHPRFLLTARGEGFRLADPDGDVYGDWDGTERRRVDRRRPPLAAFRSESA
jgi:hypothetical protein